MARELQQFDRRSIVEAIADRLEILAVIGIVDAAPGKDVLTARERGRQGALEHEHLEPVTAIAQQHHGGCRIDRDVTGANAILHARDRSAESRLAVVQSPAGKRARASAAWRPT